MTALINSLSPFTLTPSGGVSTTLATEGVGLSADIIQITHHHSGNVSPTAVLVPGATPRMQVSVPFKLAYDTFGFGVKKLTALDVYLAKFDDFVRAPGAVHQKYSLAAGAIAAAHITGWSVSADGVLMAQVEIIPLSSDGIVHPLSIIDNVSLPALSGSPILHTLGSIKINGTRILGANSNAANVAGAMTVQRTDGDKFPRAAARLQVMPTLQIGHSDPRTVLSQLGLLGADETATAEFFYKQYDPDTGVTRDDGGAYRLDVALGRFHPSGFDSSQGAVASTGITVHAIAPDGATFPFALTYDVDPNA